MKKDKLSEIIENSCPDLKESKERVWERLVAKTGYDEKKKKKFFSSKLIVASACFLLIICFTIPIVVSSLKRQDDRLRFCQTEDYNTAPAEISLSKLSETDENILFLNWEVLETVNYVDKNSGEVLCVNEYVYNESSEIELKIFVVYPNLQMDFIENQKKYMTENMLLGGIRVDYIKYQEQFLSYFQYNQYTYFLEFVGIYENETVFSIISELLNSKA